MLPNILKKSDKKKKKSKYCTPTTGSTDFLVFKRKKKKLLRNSHLLNFNHVSFNLPLRTQWNRIILPMNRSHRMSMHGQQVSNYPAAKSTRHASWLKSTCLHSTWVTCAQGFHFHSAFSFYCKYTQTSSILHTSEYFTCLRKLLPISVCCVCLTLPGCSPASPCQRCHWVFFWPGYLHALQDAGSSLCRPASLDVQSVQTHPWHKAETLRT